MSNLKKILRVTSKMDEKSTNMLIMSIKKNNLEGFDYLEFLVAVEKLIEIPMERPLAYKSAFTTASTFGVTKDKLISSGEYYLSILRKEYKSFKTALESQVEIRILNPEKKIITLEKDNDKIDLEIEKLLKKKELQKNHVQKLAKEIVDQRSNLEQKEKVFHSSFETLSNNIKEDIEELKRQL